MLYFDPSFLPWSDGITQRFTKCRPAAVTFAEDSVWPCILNLGLTLIRFIVIGDPDWSFARLGTHCQIRVAPLSHMAKFAIKHRVSILD
jgi:hypothetical protein